MFSNEATVVVQNFSEVRVRNRKLLNDRASSMPDGLSITLLDLLLPFAIIPVIEPDDQSTLLNLRSQVPPEFHNLTQRTITDVEVKTSLSI